MAVVATGFFDGVHRGHQAVVRRLVSEASSRGEDSVIVTFSPHPRAVLQNGAPQLRLLTSDDEKTALLRALHVDRVEILPFTRDFARLTAEQYVRDILIGRFGASAIVFGYDNRIGSDGAGFAQVQSIAARLGVDLMTCDPIPCGQSSLLQHPCHLDPSDDLPCHLDQAKRVERSKRESDLSTSLKMTSGAENISSTKIRQSLETGDITSANEMLGYEYFLNGVVVGGAKIGRTIGFPTANLRLSEPLKLVPANGVYLVRVGLPALYPDGRQLYGMCNIGFRPTVNRGSDITIETNIFDFDEEIYSLPMRISFLHRLRGEIRFSSTASLRDQLQADARLCREISAAFKS